ncbi:unnamed protein product, partial [marine sediment metagenome]
LGKKPEMTPTPLGWVKNRFAIKALIMTVTKTTIIFSNTLYISGDVKIMTTAMPEKTKGQTLSLIPVKEFIAVATPKLLPNSNPALIKYAETPTKTASHLPYLSETTLRIELCETTPNRDAITVKTTIETTAAIKIHMS